MTANAARNDMHAPGGIRGRANRFYIRYLVEPYLYLSPALLLICLVMLVPLAIGITYSFQSLNLLRPFSAGFVGFDNYLQLAGDRRVSLDRSVRYSGGRQLALV